MSTKKSKSVAADAGATQLERHPLSEKYGPKMSGDELAGLGKDIAEHGQHDDIIVYEGKVLAGWNRYMGCLQQGVKPRLKEMEAGADPVAVAFGTNFVRRRLSSVQKAFYGAQYCIDTGKKQADVAKLVGCNLNKLNQCVQLLKRDDKEAQRVAEVLRIPADDKEVTSGAFDEMMIELGIKKEEAVKPPPAPRTNTHTDFDDDDDFGDDDDITGGAIDALVGSDEDDDEDILGEKPSKQRKEIGEGHAPLPSVGEKVRSLTNPKETTPSRLAKAFRNLAEAEQVNFVVFAWGKLQRALNQAIVDNKVQWTPPGEHEPTPGPTTAKGKRKVEKQVALAIGKPDPSLIARGKPADDDDVLAGKEEAPAKKADKKAKAEKPAAKKAAPAKKAKKK